MSNALLGHLFRAPISAVSASGDATLVAGVSGKRIALIFYCISCDTDADLKFTDTTGDLSGLLYTTAGWGFSDYNPEGLLITRVGEPLKVNRAGAMALGGYLGYRIIS